MWETRAADIAGGGAQRRDTIDGNTLSIRSLTSSAHAAPAIVTTATADTGAAATPTPTPPSSFSGGGGGVAMVRGHPSYPYYPSPSVSCQLSAAAVQSNTLSNASSSVDLVGRRLREEQLQARIKAAREFIEKTIGQMLPHGDLHESLKDGVILCK
ncbi:hypothetical protein DFQ27_005319 [Actinomortierella ambigua]|uniref:Uncharacterized protein n=1 Tax=Actinomortierella ambigua TaxID=1343610 RepID=A0A9P6PZB1_9FUNG|nr:hypothetical protein DFQ27_005319 [Actinomortierella ambigua]